MKIYFLTGPALLAATALVSIGSAPAAAQIKASPPASTLTVAPPTPDADALAAEMRVLATDPKNVEALTRAGELTLKLGDPTAAANLFARADKIEPNNAGLKADEAAVLVHMERPGEALRLFQQAAQMGADPANFAAERGLAYDLIGQQERAQRDYRLALEADPDNAETIRRYALSLGISGKRKEALAQVDPLVRRQDHAGWRDRAFILAMTGEPDQAKKIAAAMLPPSMAEGLAPFFDKLPGLSATDKAFAVHFGDLQVTPQRLADARMAPPLPPLEPEKLSRELAAVEPPPLPIKKQNRGKHEKHRPAEQAAPAVAMNTARPESTSTVRTAPIPVHVESLPSPAAAAPAPAPSQPSPERRVAASPAPASSAAVPTDRPGKRVGEEDRILANIMAGISVPQSERADHRPPPAAASPAPSAKPAPPPSAIAAKTRRLEAANVAAIKQAAADKAAAEARRKELEAKKAAAEKKAADAKAAAEKRAREKEERANPSRIWVQVAGGAYEGDLPKAWARVKAKAPEAFKGKHGWTTPLNATNRVLAGPFKSNEAAQDFVNALAKKGIHAFPFTSDRGQKIDKLDAK